MSEGTTLSCGSPACNCSLQDSEIIIAHERPHTRPPARQGPRPALLVDWCERRAVRQVKVPVGPHRIDPFDR